MDEPPSKPVESTPLGVSQRGLSPEWERWAQEESWDDGVLVSEEPTLESGVGTGREACIVPTRARDPPSGTHSAPREGSNEPKLTCQYAWHHGDEYQKECARCREALGLRRKHEKGKAGAQNVLSVDLSGPHPETTGTSFRYMLVAVFRGEQGNKNLPFVRGLTQKQARKCAPR